MSIYLAVYYTHLIPVSMFRLWVSAVSFSPKSVSQRSSLPPEHPVLILFVRWQMFLVLLSTCV